MKKYVYYYHLKLKIFRNNIDLRDFQTEIQHAIEEKISNLVNGSIVVDKKFFGFKAEDEVDSAALRNMGRAISKASEKIRAYVVKYGNSVQLFVKMKEPEVAQLA